MKDVLLVTAGVVGAATALIHGYLTQVALVSRLSAPGVYPNAAFRRLAEMLLQFSTFNWFVGGVALVLAANMGIEARRAISLLVASSYIFAVCGNAWATEGRHIGWMIYAVVLALIALSWR